MEGAGSTKVSKSQKSWSKRSRKLGVCDVFFDIRMAPEDSDFGRVFHVPGCKISNLSYLKTLLSQNSLISRLGNKYRSVKVHNFDKAIGFVEALRIVNSVNFKQVELNASGCAFVVARDSKDFSQLSH